MSYPRNWVRAKTYFQLCGTMSKEIRGLLGESSVKFDYWVRYTAPTSYVQEASNMKDTEHMKDDMP